MFQGLIPCCHNLWYHLENNIVILPYVDVVLSYGDIWIDDLSEKRL